jgi:hypothetical protein
MTDDERALLLTLARAVYESRGGLEKDRPPDKVLDRIKMLEARLFAYQVKYGPLTLPPEEAAQPGG